MIHPGHWQHFTLRNDNRGLTTEQMRQKYLKEQLLFEEFINFQLQQQLLLKQKISPGGPNTSPTVPSVTPVTLSFEISSGSGTNVLLQIGTKVGKSVDVTVEWDAVGLVPAGSISETIAPNTTWTPTIDLEADDTNVPFRIILSDISAIQLLTWTASNDDISPNEYQIWTAPTNFSVLTGTNNIRFEFQGVSELDISNFTGNQFGWVNDITIASANLTNVNVAALAFTDCTGLTTLTLDGLTYGNESGGYEFDFFNCALTEDIYVVLLEGADASGYENGIIDISGGNNEPPAGGRPLTAISNLEGKGWEIFTN